MVDSNHTAIINDCDTAVADLQKAFNRGLMLFKGPDAPKHAEKVTALYDCQEAINIFETNELTELRKAFKDDS